VNARESRGQRIDGGGGVVMGWCVEFGSVCFCFGGGVWCLGFVGVGGSGLCPPPHKRPLPGDGPRPLTSLHKDSCAFEGGEPP